VHPLLTIPLYTEILPSINFIAGSAAGTAGTQKGVYRDAQQLWQSTIVLTIRKRDPVGQLMVISANAAE
jgi:hypothetical protein